MKARVLLTLNKKRVVPIMTQREEEGIIQLRLLRCPNCAQVNNKQLYSFTYAYNLHLIFTHTHTHRHIITFMIYAHNLHFIFTDTPYHQQNTQASKFTHTQRINKTPNNIHLCIHIERKFKELLFLVFISFASCLIKNALQFERKLLFACHCFFFFVFWFFILSTTKSEYKK